jgi:hypothetical protein
VTAFYLPLGDGRFEPTEFTESPWDTRMQHGGPPAALLAHAMAPGGDLRLGRISVDFLGPIPRKPLSVEVTTVKPGRLTALHEARLVVDGKVAVVARGWHLAAGPKPAIVTAPEPVPAIPPTTDPATDPWKNWGYGKAIEWRFREGGFGQYRGHADVWTRVLHPLIAGEEITGVERALVVADAANGLSAVLDLTEWLSIPPGMTTTMLRPAEGEWVRLACRSEVTADGLGLCTGTLSDESGTVGAVSQPLLVRSRG